MGDCLRIVCVFDVSPASQNRLGRNTFPFPCFSALSPHKYQLCRQFPGMLIFPDVEVFLFFNVVYSFLDLDSTTSNPCPSFSRNSGYLSTPPPLVAKVGRRLDFHRAMASGSPPLTNLALNSDAHAICLYSQSLSARWCPRKNTLKCFHRGSNQGLLPWEGWQIGPQ